MQGFVWVFSSVSIAQEAPHFYKSCSCSYLLQKTQLQLETVWLLGSREHLLFMYNPCVLVHQQVTYFSCNGLLVSAREMAANYLGWPPRIHHGFPRVFFLKKPHIRWILLHCLTLDWSRVSLTACDFWINTNSSTTAGLSNLAQVLFQAITRGRFDLSLRKMQPLDLSSLPWGTPAEKPLRQDTSFCTAV